MNRPQLRDTLGTVGSLLLVVLLLVSSVAPIGQLPALGPVLNPGTGLWRLSREASATRAELVDLPALDHQANISFTGEGTTHINAKTDHDLFLLTGYVHARFRLFQMDLTRRRGNGELAELLGPAALESDKFELELGLRRASERDWRALADDKPARHALTAYSQGVNAAIRSLENEHRLPVFFKTLGYRPQPWTPIDSLVVQRVMSQQLSFSDRALAFSYPATALPNKTFDEWFPATPRNEQHPYDPGPYRKLPLEPIAVGADAAATLRSQDPGHARKPPSTKHSDAGKPPTTTRNALDPLRQRLATLPPGAVHAFGNSNAWVVDGRHTASGRPILATDPHLQMTLPSTWFATEGASPGYHYSGVTMPGLPVPLMGKTDNFAWGTTNSQHPVTLYYLERTDSKYPGRYFWHGTWHQMNELEYQIRVRGRAPVTHKVKLTRHGPVVQRQGVTTSVWWAGALAQDGLGGMLEALRARSFNQFKDSLRGWMSPSLTFMYAGNDGDIGAITPGAAPQVPGHDISLPLPGDGSADVVGTIPFDALPQAHNPPNGYLAAANSREVGEDYPYQFSTSYNFVDQGWRAQRINEVLAQSDAQTFRSSVALQTDLHDPLAAALIPHLVHALDGVRTTAVERQVLDHLRTWDYRFDRGSLMGLWFKRYYNQLIYITFQPWWQHYGVRDDPEGTLTLTPTTGSSAAEVMRGTILSWIQHDPDNRYFSLPDGQKRDAKDVQREAFHQATVTMVKEHGPHIHDWRLDGQQGRIFPSLFGVPDFDSGPYPGSGSGRTVNAAIITPVPTGEPGHSYSTAGASWRFVIDWGTGEAGSCLPGGMSENPMSPEYTTGIEDWLAGRLTPVREGPSADQAASTRWRLNP